MSLNGMIADKNGKEGFLSDKNWALFVKKAEETGCFIVGRKTYEIFTRLKNYNFNKIKCKKIIVSKNTNSSNYTSASSPKNAIKIAKRLGFNNILLIGGARLNTSFIQENLIDEIIINIEPTLLGEGIKLFSEKKFYKKLKLFKIKKLKSIIQLNYKIQK